MIPTNLNFELAGWIFDLGIISEIQSPPSPSGISTAYDEVEKQLGPHSQPIALANNHKFSVPGMRRYMLRKQGVRGI
uniref:Putative ovule protein n=1 Tax=Solanum chacoense TaxID=4108 RepID=A0A0V0I8W7_SOLCH